MQDSLNNMGVKEIRFQLRKCNAARNKGELNEQFSEWIVELEKKFHKKIADILKVGNHKVQLTYYGMIYTILVYAGCYLTGKNSSPIGITRTKYCSLLKLEERLKSNNIRKTIAKNFYAHDYMITIARRKKNQNVPNLGNDLIQLEPIFEDIDNEVRRYLF